MQEVVNLRWSWEAQVPELDTSVFVIPRSLVKNGLDRYVVLNRIAKSATKRGTAVDRSSATQALDADPQFKRHFNGWRLLARGG
jgi:hypothetical protein